MESVRSMGGIDLVHVPYKGFGQGVTDVLANQVPLIFGGVTASISYVGGGKLKALGVTSAKRVKALPDVPAIAETLPGFDINAWYGFLGPANLPRDIVQKINADARAIIARPDFQERLARDGIEPVGGTPEAFAAQIKSDLARWAQVVKAPESNPNKAGRREILCEGPAAVLHLVEERGQGVHHVRQIGIVQRRAGSSPALARSSARAPPTRAAARSSRRARCSRSPPCTCARPAIRAPAG